jgi:hypothetical protein
VAVAVLMLTGVVSAGFGAAAVGLLCADAATDGRVASKAATAAIVRTLRSIESSFENGLTEDHRFAARLRSDRVRETMRSRAARAQGKTWTGRRPSAMRLQLVAEAADLDGRKRRAQVDWMRRPAADAAGCRATCVRAAARVVMWCNGGRPAGAFSCPSLRM